MIFNKNVLKYLIVILLFFFSSCVKNTPKLFVFANHKQSYNVVVIPLENDTKNSTISRIVYRVLSAELISSHYFNVTEEGAIRKFFINNIIYPGDFPALNQLRKLKELTNADIVIGGNVLEADKKNGDVKIAMILWARDISKGKLLWTTYYVKRGEDYRKFFHFGKVYTLTELASKMIHDIVNLWEKGNK